MQFLTVFAGFTAAAINHASQVTTFSLAFQQIIPRHSGFVHSSVHHRVPSSSSRNYFPFENINIPATFKSSLQMSSSADVPSREEANFD